MSQPIIAFYPKDSLSGGLARSIVAPEGTTAIVQKDGQVVTLPPGRHVVRSLWGGLLGKQPPPVWLTPAADEPLTLHPLFPNLLDAEGQLVLMDMLVAARVADPVGFWRAMQPGSAPVTKSDIEQRLAQALAGRIRNLVRKYPLDSLLDLPQAQEAVQRGVMQSLRALLNEWGMALLGVTHLGFQKAAEAVTIERQVQAIQQALADIRLQAQIDEMENEAVLQHARAEFGLTDAEVAELQAQLAQEKSAREAMETLLTERLEHMKEAIEARLDALAEKQKRVKKTQPSPVPSHKNLERLVVSLRIAFYIIAAITAANALFYRYLPFLNEYNDHFHLAGSILGLLLALAALVSAWLVDRRRAFQAAQAQQAEQHRLSRQERERKIARERAIRRYFQKRLELIADNCEEIWKRIYQDDIKLATAIRQQCVKPYRELAKTVMAADYTTSRFFRQNHVSVEELAGLLDLSEKLRDNAEKLVQLSQQAYQAAGTRDLDTVQRLLRQLDNDRMALKTQFAEREQFLMT